MLSAQLQRKAKRPVPLIVIGGLAYINYSSCYIITYQEYYLRNHKAAAIVIWILFGILQLLFIVYWIAIFRQGCGSYPEFPNFDLYKSNAPGSSRLPYAFFCDEQGYPFWCSKCKNLKPNRTFHSTDADKCVPKFDHFCMWIGAVIGRDNYVAFVKYLQFFGSYLLAVFVLLTVSKVSVTRRDSSKVKHYIASYILVLFPMTMIFASYIMAFHNMAVNLTSLDEITVKQARAYKRFRERQRRHSNTDWMCEGKVPRIEDGVRYINVTHGDTRAVMLVYVQNPFFSLGFKRNLVNIFLNGNINDNFSTTPYSEGLFRKALFVCFVPLIDLHYSRQSRKLIPSTYEDCADKFSPNFIAFLQKTIDEGNFTYPSYVNNLASSSTED